MIRREKAISDPCQGLSRQRAWRHRLGMRVSGAPGAWGLQGGVRFPWQGRCKAWAVKLPQTATFYSKVGNMVSGGHNITHGESHGGMPEYQVWRNMKTRCLNPRAPQYKHYGGRGIVIDPTWVKSYLAFLNDMGRRPSPKHSIERKDNNGPYCKSNCVWATKSQQNGNRRVL